MSENPKSFIKSIIGFSISSWIGFVIGIISVPLLTRLFDPIQFAIINQFNAATLFFLSLVTLGMDSGFVRFFLEPPSGFNKNQLLGKCLGSSILVLIVLTVISLPFYRSLSNILFGINNWIITLFFFVAILSQITIRFFTIYYRMLNNIAAFTIITVVLQIVSKFAVLGALPFNGDKTWLLAANTLGVLLLSLGILFVNIKNQTISWSSTSLLKSKEFTTYSFGSWLVPVVIFANIYFSQIIVRHFAGEKILGIYLSANIFAGILAVVQSGFSNYWSVYMFANYDKTQNLIKKMHDYICFLAILAICGLILMKDILYLFIGYQFHASKPIFALVIAAPLFSMIGETTAYGISINKKAYLSLFSYSSYLILNLTLSFLFVPIWGMFGAALSLMVSALVNLIIQTVFGQKYYKSIITLKRTVYAIGTIVLLSLINYRYDDNMLITSGVIIFIIFLSLFIYIKPLKHAFILIRSFSPKYSRINKKN